MEHENTLSGKTRTTQNDIHFHYTSDIKQASDWLASRDVIVCGKGDLNCIECNKDLSDSIAFVSDNMLFCFTCIVKHAFKDCYNDNQH